MQPLAKYLRDLGKERMQAEKTNLGGVDNCFLLSTEGFLLSAPGLLFPLLFREISQVHCVHISYLCAGEGDYKVAPWGRCLSVDSTSCKMVCDFMLYMKSFSCLPSFGKAGIWTGISMSPVCIYQLA